MNPLPLEEIAELSGAQPAAAGAGINISRISKDTRTLEPGDLYLAIRGEHFDGNRFVAEAAARGAAAALVDRPEAMEKKPPADFPVLVVRDSIAALHKLAAAWRERLHARVVCVTGSNGKTSTKDFAAAVLARRFSTTRTSGNLNNHLGLPLTILEAQTSHAAAVWEIAMNHTGEIAPLAALARPDIGIITGIGVAHIEHLGSREAIAVEKGMLFEALGAEGTAIVPDACDFADSLAARTRARVVRTGGPASDIRAENVRPLDGGSAFEMAAGGDRVEVHLPVPGAHMVSNALLAAAAGLACGLSAAECAEGLSSARLTGGRLARRILRGVAFLDDTYNANPDSVEAALDTLAALPATGRRIAVLGFMGELGAYAPEGYRRVGAAAAGRCEVLVTVGSEAEAIARSATGTVEIHSVESPAAAGRLLAEICRPGDLVLVKGSRSARMEKVLEEF